jgi:hypothetical protein
MHLEDEPGDHSLSNEWKSTSRPAAIWTSLGQPSVLLVSTIPSVGFKALEAIPVLNDREGISRIAVPVVSDPVPFVISFDSWPLFNHYLRRLTAVVGTDISFRHETVSKFTHCR